MKSVEKNVDNLKRNHQNEKHIARSNSTNFISSKDFELDNYMKSRSSISERWLKIV